MTHMGIFRWLRRERAVRSEDVEKLDAFRQLQSDMKQLRLEWEETYETVHRQLRKLGKRAKEQAPEEIVAPESNGAVEPASKDDLRRLARAKGYRV